MQNQTLKEALNNAGYNVKDLHDRVLNYTDIKYKALWVYSTYRDRSSGNPQTWLVIDEALKDMGVGF